MGLNFGLPDGATPLDPDEAADLIPALSTLAELNDFERRNIAKAILWTATSKSVRSKIPDVDSLKLLHKRMFNLTWKWAGRWRTTQKSIGVESWRIPSELRNLIEDTKIWVEFNSYPTKEIAARFHHRLVLIHPFPNGDGRHARLAAELLCRAQGWPEPTWGRSNLAPAANARHTYIRALRKADAHDLAPLIDFMWS